MEYREKILSLARTQPLLPNTVAKALNTNSIMAGAMLSEMCSKKLLKTSTLKVGGSPLYYIPGNETQLLNHTASLNEKDRRTVEKLKQEKIIRDQEADPLTRVSLAAIKDFAKPLEVIQGEKQEIFYKWFELNDQDAEHLIKQKLELHEEKKPEPPAAKAEPIAETRQERLEEQEKKAEPTREISETPAQNPARETGEFWDKLHDFFGQNKIQLIEKTNIKKKTEYDLIIEMPSPLGTLSYYCKARSKKKLTEGDISAAYVQGQLKKLPVILITDGELTKQAKAMLLQLKGITIKKI